MKKDEKAKNDDEHVTREECERELSVKLNDKELISYSKELARKQCEKVEKDERKKEIMAEYTAELKKFDADIGVLARKVTTGQEQRTVKCVWIFDWKEGGKKLIRTDTEEVVREETIQASERQQHFALEEQAKKVKEASDLKEPIGELIDEKVVDKLSGD
jgi:hypothetical protein